MNREELEYAIARKLYHLTRNQVSEIMEVMLELWREELLRPGGYIHLPDIGKLQIECQKVHSAGAINKTQGGDLRQPLSRFYGRFTPAKSLRQTLKQKENNQ